MGPGAGAAGPHHQYTFELFALDIKLDLGPGFNASGLSQSNYYYEGSVFLMCPLLLSHSRYLNNNAPI